MIARPDVFRIVIALSPPLDWNNGTFSTDAAMRIASDTLHRRTLFLASGGLEPPIDAPTTAFAAHLTALLDSLHTNPLRFERRRYPRDTHEMTPLPGLVDGLRMAFDPILVPIDSVIGELAAHHVQGPSEIRATTTQLESRYAAGAAMLGVPGLFPEAPLDVLGGYSLDAKQSALAVELLRENRDRYPHSSNAHESMGEGLLAVGDTAGAVGESARQSRLQQRSCRNPDRFSPKATNTTSKPPPWHNCRPCTRTRRASPGLLRCQEVGARGIAPATGA